MSQRHFKYVLVGGGLTSASAAEAIRKRDTVGSVLMVGQEVNRPYHRPRLNTHYLRGERGRAEITVDTANFFSQHNIALSTGRRVAQLDTNRHTVTLDSGEELSFDNLLIATGASPKALDVPGADLPNVFSLRTVSDADRLHNAIEKAKVEGQRFENPGPLMSPATSLSIPAGSEVTPPLAASPRTGRGIVAVIGAGALGVELATTLTQLGLQVELIVGASHPWRKFAGANTGSILTHLLQTNGVRVHLTHRVQQLEGDGRVQRAVLSDGTIIPCDFAITAIGVRPNIEILRNTPITAEKAILVDPHCQTSVPGIYAAGDCAAVFDPLFGKHRLIDHWDNARVTGAIAGDNMAGGDAKYDAVNCFRSNVFGLPMVCWGEARLVDRRHIRGNVNVDSPSFLEIGVASDGRIAQVLSIGENGDEATLAELVRQRAAVNGNEEALKDPARPLSDFLT